MTWICCFCAQCGDSAWRVRHLDVFDHRFFMRSDRQSRITIEESA